MSVFMQRLDLFEAGWKKQTVRGVYLLTEKGQVYSQLILANTGLANTRRA